MGSCISTTDDRELHPKCAKISPTRQHFKRNFSRRRSSSSSGVSSRASTPSRRRIFSRSTTPQFPSANVHPRKINFNDEDLKESLQRVAICDDFSDTPAKQRRQQIDNSCGYCSASQYTGSSSDVSSPTNSCLRRTQDTSEIADNVDAIDNVDTVNTAALKATSDLEMEMYMMISLQTFMPKTSSPVLTRRDETFEVLNSTSSALTKSYQHWQHYLQSTPAYMMNNISHLPEAIAGLFCPQNFPSYTDLDDMESPAKRYKVDLQQDMKPSIVSTEL